MLTHSQVQAAISAHMDGEHSDLSQDVIDTHLESCAECRAFRVSINDVLGQIGVLSIHVRGDSRLNLTMRQHC